MVGGTHSEVALRTPMQREQEITLAAICLQGPTSPLPGSPYHTWALGPELAQHADSLVSPLNGDILYGKQCWPRKDDFPAPSQF